MSKYLIYAVLWTFLDYGIVFAAYLYSQLKEITDWYYWSKSSISGAFSKADVAIIYMTEQVFSVSGAKIVSYVIISSET